jgi:hypothetical protein
VFRWRRVNLYHPSEMEPNMMADRIRVRGLLFVRHAGCSSLDLANVNRASIPLLCNSEHIPWHQRATRQGTRQLEPWLISHGFNVCSQNEILEAPSCRGPSAECRTQAEPSGRLAAAEVFIVPALECAGSWTKLSVA